MSTTYRVKQGDHISGIAKSFGFPDYRPIWNDQNNSQLRALRVNPNVLFPGDQVYIPDLVSSEFSRPTDVRHKFKVYVRKLTLRLILEDLYERPISGARCDLQIGSDKLLVTTGSSGQVEQEIAADVTGAMLTIKSSQTPFDGIRLPIDIGYLDPVSEVSGQQARLTNLGYFWSEIDGLMSGDLASAIEEFQCDTGLAIDGVCGPATQVALKRKHGC